MSDLYPPGMQRVSLFDLAKALTSRDSALRRDENGDWRIKGRFGHIYAVPGGFQIYFRGADEFEEPASPHGWTFCKRAMPFAKVTQDGDTEGILFLDRFPTPNEAEIIRDKLRIFKKREMSEEELERLRRSGFRAGGERLGKKTPSDDPEAS